MSFLSKHNLFPNESNSPHCFLPSGQFLFLGAIRLIYGLLYLLLSLFARISLFLYVKKFLSYI